MPVGETTSISKNNEPCPECGKPMSWTEGLLWGGARDGAMGRYGCMPCRLFKKPGESRAMQRGRELANSDEFIGVYAMDKKITSLSCNTQIGLLRERQHCKTCKNNMGDPCKCGGKCNCLYCRIQRGEIS